MKTSWLPAEGKEFCYECHNESKPDTSASDMTKGNSEGRNSNSNGYYSKSSNIQGQPSFRLRLPAQNKMVGFFKRMYNTNNIQGRHFSAVERDVNYLTQNQQENKTLYTKKLILLYAVMHMIQKLHLIHLHMINTLEQEQEEEVLELGKILHLPLINVM
jgi:hypothetical protein